LFYQVKEKKQMYIKKHTPYLVFTAVVVLMLTSAGVGAVWAASGTLDSSAAPDVTSSYTLEDLYNRLTAGTVGTQSTWAEPSSGPTTGTGHTLNQIMDAAPAIDNAMGAGVADVASGMTFWGLTSTGWGLQTGTADWAPCNCNGGTLVGTRWCDNGDGTVTDLLGDSTNGYVGRCLVWLRNADCREWLYYIYNPGFLFWKDASIWSSTLSDGYCGLANISSAYEWRLPTLAELDGITNGTEAVDYNNWRAFSIQDICYWSSTNYPYDMYEGDVPNFWGVCIYNGNSYPFDEDIGLGVWPVRGGQ
jgi:hypothetical protein